MNFYPSSKRRFVAVRVDPSKGLISVKIDPDRLTPKRSEKLLVALWKKQNFYRRKYGAKVRFEIGFMRQSWGRFEAHA